MFFLSCLTFFTGFVNLIIFNGQRKNRFKGRDSILYNDSLFYTYIEASKTLKKLGFLGILF